ncbi:hypothetical protein ACFQH8_13515 [Halomicroarcula sp. GCM10025710]
MFVNYFADSERSSPVNLAVGRTILTVWLVWKTAMYDWNEFFEVPFYLTPEFTWAVPPVAPGLFMTAEKWVLIGLLVLFAVGYRVRFTGGVSALVLAHFGAVREIQNNSGETQALFLGVYFLLFYSLFSETHVLSADGLRQTKDWSVDSLRSFIVSGRDSYQLPALKWSLLVIAMIYFGSGFNSSSRTVRSAGSTPATSVRSRSRASLSSVTPSTSGTSQSARRWWSIPC